MNNNGSRKPTSIKLNNQKFLSVDLREKPYKLGKIIKITDSDKFGIVFDTWNATYGIKLKAAFALHADKMRKAAFTYKPQFFQPYNLVCVEHNGKLKRGRLGFKIIKNLTFQKIKLIDQAKFVEIKKEHIYALHKDLHPEKINCRVSFCSTYNPVTLTEDEFKSIIPENTRVAVKRITTDGLTRYSMNNLPYYNCKGKVAKVKLYKVNQKTNLDSENRPFCELSKLFEYFETR